MSNWNPRYVLWAKKHGLTPEQMMEKNDRYEPGFMMMDFSFWIQAEVKAICDFYGAKPYDLRSIIGLCGDPDFQKVFDQWLESRILTP